MEPVTPTSVDRLLASARTGDLPALDRLLALQRIELLALVRRTLGPRLAARVEAEDLFQEASLQAMHSITALRSDEVSGFKRWFLGIVRHRLLLHVQSSRPRVRPRRTTPLPDSFLSFRDPETIETVDHQSGFPIDRRESHGSRMSALFADGRMTMVLHEIFTSGFETIAFLLDRPSREAVRQLHVRVRARPEFT